MPRLSTLLLLLGALCVLAAIVSIGLTLTAPAPVSAAGLRSIGTPTLPPLPTAESTQIATAVPATATPTSVPTITTPPPTATTATPVQPPPTAPVPPTRTRPPRDPDPTATPLPTAVPSATPELWTSEVTISKQASASAVQPGATFVYTLVARNSGPHSAFDVVVRDDVPPQLAIIDLASSKGDIQVQGQVVTAYPGTLEPGETAEYRITVRVRPDARPGALVNVGVITTSTPGDTPANNTSTVTVTIRVPQRAIQTAPPQHPLPPSLSRHRPQRYPPPPSRCQSRRCRCLSLIGLYCTQIVGNRMKGSVGNAAQSTHRRQYCTPCSSSAILHSRPGLPATLRVPFQQRSSNRSAGRFYGRQED